MTDSKADDVDAEVSYEDPKKPDPFFGLPKSTMVLDACKRAYNVAKHEGRRYFETEFWTQYDPVGFSVHMGKYKFNDDLSGMDFVRRNQVGGMVQTMDAPLAHKHLFGVFKIVKGASREVLAVFVTRGDAINNDVFCDVSNDFDWEKLDTSDDTVKSIVASAFHDTSNETDDMFDGKLVEHHVMFL